jgi:hypothetical protein
LAAQARGIPVIILKERSVDLTANRTIGGQAVMEVPDNAGIGELREVVEKAPTELFDLLMRPARRR